MTLSQALFTHIAALSDVVSTAGTRVYSVEAPRPDPATATYEDVVVIAFEGATFDSLNSDTFQRVAQYTIAIVSKVHLRAVALAESICRSLHGYAGTMGGSGGVAVTDCTAEEGPEDYDSENGLFARSVMLSITYTF